MRNYIEGTSKEIMGNDYFTSSGFEDGYADLEDDSNNILIQLYRNTLEDDLISYITNYLNGYEIGKFMSEEAAEIYDEDGNFKEDEYCLEPCASLNQTIALNLVKKYKG